MIARSSFVEARRYADALIGESFGQMLNLVEAGSQQLARLDAPLQAMGRRTVIDETLTNIEVLTGAGKLEEARILTEKFSPSTHRRYPDSPPTACRPRAGT